MRFQVDNEYGTLEAVLVHRPGREIDRLTHDNAARFLFEDAPYLKRMQDEHDAFVGTMRDHGVVVYHLETMLRDVLLDDDRRRELVADVCRHESVPGLADDLTDPKLWGADALVEVLFAGLTAGEHAAVTGGRLTADGDEYDFLVPPVPNAYFSRDPAVIVRDAAISSKMHFRERVRETLLTRAVLEQHPECRKNAITYGGSDEPTEDRPYTIEGGDVIILSPDAVLIGCSERTRSETIERLADKCFHVGQVKRVYEIPVPTERAFMHLDTVFTVVDRGKVLWYPPVMDGIHYIHRYEPNADGGATRILEERGLLDVLREEFGMDVTVIDTGGGNEHFSTREQRMDGANALAISPGVVITYQRNEHTMRALEDAGVRCISIDGAELVRGLGGPRCMTMPLRRRS